MLNNPLELANFRFIKRIVVGNDNPDQMRSEAEIQSQMDLVNLCLGSTPRGRILGLEKNVSVRDIGGHEVIMQSLVYHIGFERKPYFLDEAK